MEIMSLILVITNEDCQQSVLLFYHVVLHADCFYNWIDYGEVFQCGDLLLLWSIFGEKIIVVKWSILM